MKFVSTFAFLSFLLCVSLSAKSKDEYKTSLSSGTPAEKEEALQYFIQSGKDSSLVPSTIEILKTSNTPSLTVLAAIYLGKNGVAGDSTKALKDRINTDSNKEVAYASLVGILAIQLQNKELEPEAKQAFDIANELHASDPFVKDLLDKVKLKNKKGFF